MSPDVVVVGGGIIGCAATAFLAQAGARVVLIERDGLASGASGANSGIVQHPFDPVLAGLYHATVGLYRELASRSVSFPFAAQPSGMLFLSPREEDARRQADLIAGRFPQIRTKIVGGTDLQQLEPTVGPDLWACRADIGFPVSPGASTYAYATLAEQHGAQIRQGRSATLAFHGETAAGVRIDGTLLSAGAVVAAAGPWAAPLLDPTGWRAPIRPLWGVVVEVELPAPPRHILEEAGIEATIGVPVGVAAADAGGAVPALEAADADEVDFSLAPLPGASVVGSTFLYREPDPETWTEAILVHAARYVPGVMDAPIRGVRACARPQCRDGRPVVGAVPGIHRLYVCAGHGPWGISTGPASARLITEMVLGAQPQIPDELSPARFVTPLC